MYLFMSNAFVERIAFGDNFILKFVDITAEVLVIVPLFTFWYKEFKSIGKNVEVIYNKKPSLFGILEDIVELKLTNYLKEGKRTYDKKVREKEDKSKKDD